MGLDFNPNRLNPLFQQQLNQQNGVNRTNPNQQVGGVSRTQEQGAEAAIGSANAFALAAQAMRSQFQSPTELGPGQRVGGTESVGGPSSTQFQPGLTRLQGAGSPSDVQGIDVTRPQSQDGFYGAARFAGNNAYDQAKAQPAGLRLQMFA
jgi:hypothetical protein